VNGNGALETSEIVIGDSLAYLGQLLPTYVGSLSTNVALFGGAVGVTADLSYQGGATQVDRSGSWVFSRALTDPAAPLSEQAAVLATGLGTEYGLMQAVSTVRINSVSVRYRAPERVARLLGARQLSVALQGANLGLHSSYRGKDPNVTAWGPGEAVYDTGQLPQPRDWQFRLDLDY
jgi:hypothetical protein